jgi:hypothetical protein
VVSLSQGDVCLSCPGAVELGVLLPHLAGVIVEEVTAAAGLLPASRRAVAAGSATYSPTPVVEIGGKWYIYSASQ